MPKPNANENGLSLEVFCKIELSPLCMEIMDEQYTKIIEFHLKPHFKINGNCQMFK